MVVKKMCESASMTQTENQKHFKLIELEMAETPKFLFSRLPYNVGPYCLQYRQQTREQTIKVCRFNSLPS